ncbi:conserved hypothetical protein [Histoplasma capsulatum var. duboisii H88]|uniref:Cut12 superfamily domain-containing protein n=1 Tax=Ajellomyces capsulatus (strain H88) TaxID=544711 RepID=F0USP0_AJEC8|nr:conserved hypothetical protein [Histoplasma capsulatum var. duboisii H88]QSS54513.1 Cut12 superfamily domain-containing protein [Histoplasma capsulatum var. duboisii H88]
MLGWFAGSGRGEYTGFADDSKAQEAPETPAPVFAFRAFKNAIVGTPGPDATDDELTIPIRSLKPTVNRKDTNIHIPPKPKNSGPLDLQPSLPTSDVSAQPMASPTKSILLTPGTAATRRKTVSFGEGVVDNERKKSLFEPIAYNGNISRQWTGKQHEESGKNRSKPTKSLFEARSQKLGGEKKRDENDELFDITDRIHPPPDKEAGQPRMKEEQRKDEDEEENEEDVTTNLDEPHSQSGMYWKSEFDSYRARTDREIKKLIQYRSVAKSYAKKKDLEMRRLSDKLKREEAKVAEMELRVSKLAAGMVDGTNQNQSNEDMFKELSEQTALAVQYKRKADSLRKALERHGVIESDGESQENSASSEDLRQKLRKMEKALELANSQLKEFENNKSDTSKLQDLAESSECKAVELQKENKALKLSLARFKEEMTNYEDRRKAKEARLKQKEQKLQDRVQEYKNRLDEAKQHHLEAEQVLRQSFIEEKQHMQDMIDSLRHNISIAEHASHNNVRRRGETKEWPNRSGPNGEHNMEDWQDGKYSPRKGTEAVVRITQGYKVMKTGSSRKDLVKNEYVPGSDNLENTLDEHIDMMEPKSRLSERSEARLGVTKRSRTDTLTDCNEDDNEPPTNPQDSPVLPKNRTTRTIPYRDDPSIPPSSPPTLPPVENSPVPSPEKRRPRPNLQSRSALSPRPSMVHISSNPTHPPSRLSSQYHNHLRRKISGTRVLPRTSAKAATAMASYSGMNRQGPIQGDEAKLCGSNSLHSPASLKRDSLPADRVAAAMRRLKLRDQRQRISADGKENVWSA